MEEAHNVAEVIDGALVSKVLIVRRVHITRVITRGRKAIIESC